MEEILKEGFAELGIGAAEDACGRFRTYYERLAEVGSVMNLTAIEGEEPVVRLHFLDSAALLGFADFGGARVIDVGTGAGFPACRWRYSGRTRSSRCSTASRSGWISSRTRRSGWGFGTSRSCV